MISVIKDLILPKESDWLRFFVKHYGKTRFMLAMSKKMQYHGMENLYQQNPAEFWVFFCQFLTRDLIIYVFIPIMIAKMTL